MQDEPETSAASAHDKAGPVRSRLRRTLVPQPRHRLMTRRRSTTAPCRARSPNGGVGAAMPAYVYAIGRIEPRFPSLSAEKEFAQATGRAETAGLTDRQALHQILTQRQNRYLVRQLCWVLTIEGLDTYILHPRDPADLDLLVEALRPTPRSTDVDCVVGVRGPDRPARAVQRADGADRGLRSDLLLRCRFPDQIDPATGEGDRQGLRGHGRGAFPSDHADGRQRRRDGRAPRCNYLALRYPAVYATAADAFGRNASLTAIEVRPSPLSGVRKIVEVIFCFTNRQTDVVEKFFTRVDVTEEFPFLVTKMSPYYDRT